MRVAFARHDALFRGGHPRPRRPRHQDHGRRVPRRVRRVRPDAVAAAARRPTPTCGRAVGRGRPVRVRIGAAHRRGRGARRRLLRAAPESGGAPAGDRATAGRSCCRRRRPRWCATPCPTASGCSTSGGIGSRTWRSRSASPRSSPRTSPPTSRRWPRSTRARTTSRPTRPPCSGASANWRTCAGCSRTARGS